MFSPDLAISDGTVNPRTFSLAKLNKQEEHFYSLTFLPLGIHQQLDGTLLYIRRDSRTTQTPIILTLVLMDLSSYFPRMIYLPQSPEIRTGVKSLIRLHIHWNIEDTSWPWWDGVWQSLHRHTVTMYNVQGGSETWSHLEVTNVTIQFDLQCIYL